jgi:hypothetical protein
MTAVRNFYIKKMFSEILNNFFEMPTSIIRNLKKITRKKSCLFKQIFWYKLKVSIRGWRVGSQVVGWLGEWLGGLLAELAHFVLLTTVAKQNRCIFL